MKGAQSPGGRASCACAHLHPFVFPSEDTHTLPHPRRISPKLRPTTQCHVGVCFLSNSFLTKAAMSFSIVYLSMA